jgi:transketolase
MTTGSLGQGLSAAIGIALSHRIDGINSKVFVIIGDGESNEGQVWEAAQAASQFKLNQIIAFTDYNKLQLDGFMHEIMSIEDITAKWVSFGWFVQRINGHDISQIDLAITRAKKEPLRPSMIVIDTIKGKGVDFAENQSNNHNIKMDYETALAAIEKL